LRLVFAGTPPFAARALEALQAAGHEVVLVLSQPDRPSGRGLRVTPSAVAHAASSLGLVLAKPASLREPDVASRIADVGPEILVVAAYGQILPKSVLAIPPRGCLNIHASLLPRWRGAAPIQRAILAGDAETGVGIMVMEAGLDTGPVLLERRIPILPMDTAGTLTDKLAALGAEAIVEALARLDSLAPVPQESAKATYAAKVEKSEALLDWHRDAGKLDRQIRAFSPVPGAETRLDGKPLKIWEAEPVDMTGPPGTVIGAVGGRPVVACGKGALALTIVQRPGSRKMPAFELLKARPMPPGTTLGSSGAPAA
jgi:methionyl-tRNA formyltransferase